MEYGNFIFLILLVILLSQYECFECSGFGINKKDCNERELRSGDYRCCYLYYRHAGDETKKCVPIDKIHYDDIKTYLKPYKEVKEAKGSNFTFDCNSNYIIISMLWLVLVLF